MPHNLDNPDNEVLLIGSGFMAKEYLKVLQGLNQAVTVIGRRDEKIGLLRSEYPQFRYYSGGLEKYLLENGNTAKFAINAVSTSQLSETANMLSDAGVKYQLLEKPGEFSIEKLHAMDEKAKRNGSKIFVAYNRRFYQSVNTLVEEANADGGITSVHFEFTEWVHTIDPEIYDRTALNKWIIANSSHVIDTVFYLIGLPKNLNTIVQGKDIIDWHPSGSIFLGSGISVNEIPFTYHSNWLSAGRWAIEVSTRQRRFYLKPMETLQQQLKGSVQITQVEIDDQLDKDYKSGLFLQTERFLNLDFSGMIDLGQQAETIHFYNKMGAYS